MVRSTPGAGRADVVADGSMFLPLVRNTEDVRNGRHAATTRATCAPGIGLPCNQSTVLLGADFYASIGRRTRPSHFELGITLQHDADWLAPSFLRNLGGEDPPTIRRKFAAETSADVVLMNADVCRRHFQGLRHLTGNARNILRRDMREQMIRISPLGNRPMTLKTAVCDHRNAVEPLGSDIRF